MSDTLPGDWPYADDDSEGPMLSDDDCTAKLSMAFAPGWKDRITAIVGYTFVTTRAKRVAIWMRCMLAAYIDGGLPLPERPKYVTEDGRKRTHVVILKVPPDLKASVQARAKQDGVSVAHWCRSVIEQCVEEDEASREEARQVEEQIAADRALSR